MSIHDPDVARWSRNSVAWGAALWALLALFSALGLTGLDPLELALLLAFFVIIPLATSLALSSLDTDSKPDRLPRLVALAQPWAALAAATSFLPPRGLLAAACATLWLLFTLLVALAGALRLLRSHPPSLAETCLSLALIYLPIGAFWFVLARLGAHPLGFGRTTVLLTAVHFHFITLAALVLTGLTGRALPAMGWPRTTYRLAAVGMLITPLLVAGGITITQLTNVRAPESAAAVLLALCLMLVAALSLRYVVPAKRPPLARALLTVSGASVFLAMLLAGAYAIGNVTSAWTITIPEMIAVHGSLNALGFGLCGLIGWRLSIDNDERKPQGA